MVRVLAGGVVWLIGAGLISAGLVGCESSPSTSPERPASADRAIHFTQIAEASGLRHRNISGDPKQRFIVESISAGVAVLDIDGDGWFDLFFVGGTRATDPPEAPSHELYLNEAGHDGRRFRRVTDESGLSTQGWGMGTAIGDIDNDGDPDLYVTYWGRDQLWRNDSSAGNVRFTEITSAAGIQNDDWGTSAAFADIDADGWLDLYVTNYLEFDVNAPPADGSWCHFKEVESFCGPEGIPAQSDRLYHNLGDGRFEEISQSSGIGSISYPGLGVLFTDIEDDGDLDIYIANDSEPNFLFRNNSSAEEIRFEQVGTRLGVAYSEGGLAQAGMGVDGGDIDNDGDRDLYVSNFSDDVNTLYTNDGHGWYTDATYATGMGRVVRPFLGWSTAFADYDNDGWLDLFVANGHVYPALQQVPGGLRYAQRNLLYHNEAGRFTEIGQDIGLHRVSTSRAAAPIDFDNDGDLDLVVANLNDTPSLWRNDGGNVNGWLGLRLIGESSNRDAIGTRVRLFAGDVVQTRQLQRGRGFQSQFDPRLVFGLGASGSVDSLVISWPSGQRQIVRNPPTRRYLEVVEGTQPVEGPQVPKPTSAPLATSTMPAPAAPEQMKVDERIDAGTLRRLASELYRQGRYEESRRHLERGLEVEEQDVTSHINLATVHFSGRGDYEEATSVLSRALDIDPQRAEAHHLLGKIQLQQSLHEEAIVSLKEAARLSPTSGEYEGWVGLAYQRDGQMDAAEKAYRTAARLAPWDPRPYLNLGRLYEQTDRDSVTAARAFAEFERLSPAQRRVNHYKRKLAEYPDHPAAPYLLGRTYYEQGRFGLAEKNYKLALQLDPNHAPTLHAAGRLLQDGGKLTEAANAYLRARESDPDLQGIDNDLGQVYHFQKRFDLAVDAYNRALDRTTDAEITPTLLSNLAMAHAMTGQLNQAREVFERSVALKPDQIDTRDALGQVLMALGEVDAAAAQWREILRLQPGNSVARQRLQEIEAGR